MPQGGGGVGVFVCLGVAPPPVPPPPPPFRARNAGLAPQPITAKHAPKTEQNPRGAAFRATVPDNIQTVSVVVSKGGDHRLHAQHPHDPVNGRATRWQVGCVFSRFMHRIDPNGLALCRALWAVPVVPKGTVRASPWAAVPGGRCLGAQGTRSLPVLQRISLTKLWGCERGPSLAFPMSQSAGT